MGSKCSKVAPQNLYVALYEYKARCDTDMSIKKNDKLEILDETRDDWLYAQNSKGKKGWIPYNYVAPLASDSAQPWYFGKLLRPQADKFLRNPKNKTGTFLIRESENNLSKYVLSILYQADIKHYRIRSMDQGGFFIKQSIHFSNLQGLVKHYSKDADGLCCALSKPCVMTDKPVIEGLAIDKWEIPRKELQTGDKLGAGQFGEVFKGYWNRKTVVAIKMLKANATEIEQFLEEAQLMKKMTHSKLVQLYGVCTMGKPVFIVTEFMPNGSLEAFLRSPKGRQLTQDRLIDMATQVASGMAFLEEKKYIHRDLAARNVLVGEKNIVKIADFGLARAIPDNVYMSRSGAKFPVRWTAIEAINYQEYSIKSDVWSFGILLTEIITFGWVPYPGLQNDEVIDLLNRGHRMQCPPKCPDILYKLMLSCWDADPEKRPTFASLQDALYDFFSIGSEYLEEGE